MYTSAPTKKERHKEERHQFYIMSTIHSFARISLQNITDRIDISFAVGIFEGQCLAMECSRSQLSRAANEQRVVSLVIKLNCKQQRWQVDGKRSLFSPLLYICPLSGCFAAVLKEIETKEIY